MRLSRTQIDAYGTDGYLIVRNAVEPDLLQGLIEAADRFATEAEGLQSSTSILELDDAASGASSIGLIRRIKSPHLHDSRFAAALAHPELLDMVEQLIGPDIRWHHTKLNAKQPAGSGHVEWHTDWGYYPHKNSDLLEIGVAIDPATEANGCLRVLPGSHLGPALDHTENSVFVGAVQRPDRRSHWR